METTRDGLRAPTRSDAWIAVAQSAVSVISGATPARRPDPAAVQRLTQVELAPDARRHSAALMRVNHVGEICAQAMYEAQALATHNHELRGVFRQAAAEEADHLAWTRGRVDELGDRVSLLAPLWYAGAFAIGYVAAALGGDRASLGFMAETENQVEEHLHSHLERLPPDDRVSRAIVEQMKAEEVGHAQTAREHGGVELPLPARWAMRLAARVMTTTAYYL